MKRNCNGSSGLPPGKLIGGMAAGLLAILLGGRPVHAGPYNPAEPDEWILARTLSGPLAFSQFWGLRNELRFLGLDTAPTDNIRRRRHVLVVDLMPRGGPARLSAANRLTLSAYLIRRKRLPEAIELLLPHVRRDPEDFLATANLAAAYHLSNEPRQAREYQRQVLAAWPASFDKLKKETRDLLAPLGWNQDSFARVSQSFLQAEKFLGKLFDLRGRERLRGGMGQDAPDDLFGVRFIGASGQYEPGKLAAGEKAKLPANAVAIVQQLLIWLPEDDRLYWLLGELYNAQGQIEIAKQIFDELAGFQGTYRVPLLNEHRQALLSAPRKDENLEPTASADKPAAPPPEPRADSIDWRSLWIGFAMGILAAFFGYWQFRETRRRRMNRARNGTVS
jgi:hypothetical protein